MDSREQNLADEIAQICFNHYSQLGKRGKPIKFREWTLLAAVVLSVDNNLSVVSMATGTKCIGQNAMSSKGDVVNDSHAEVLARRCFLRYLYDQMKKTRESGSSDIFLPLSGKCLLRPNTDVILFTSHVPCGDASIIPKTIKHMKQKCLFSSSDEPEFKKFKVSDENGSAVSKEKDCDLMQNVDSNFSKTCSFISGHINVIKNVDNTAANIASIINDDQDTVLNEDIGDIVDVYRTGAKCVGDKIDPKLPGVSYHALGAVRTKPGRGYPTLSVSCSDKIASWLAVGLQGACLSLLIACPVQLKYIVVAAGGPYCEAALHRALVCRTQIINAPTFLKSTLVFEHSRYKANAEAKPCPTSIMWAKVSKRPLEIGVDGRRQGTTKKALDKGRLMISKVEFFKTFISLTGDKYKDMTYREVKNSAVEYQNKQRDIKEKLGAWTEKPKNLTEFKIAS